MLTPPDPDTAPPHGHLNYPDYSRPVFQVPEKSRQRILDKLVRIYGNAEGRAACREIERLMQVYHAHKRPETMAAEANFQAEERLSEKDVILITYGDMIQGGEGPPLAELCRFAENFLSGSFNGIHLLPFFPSSSDRGFAVMDFKQVEARIGNWSHITRLKSRFKLMMDLVLNHVSAKHPWFQEFLNQHPDFAPFFIAFPDETAIPEDQMRKIVRPRTSALLSAVDTLAGPKSVWTTFSNDQVDLNYAHWPVLARIVETLLFYVCRGADFIRLDAVTYLWKKLGTTCVHLPENHLVVQLFRDILDAVAPHVAIITETNVAHAENITYFGNGRNEAQMVYNFALPPLLLYTFLRGSCSKLAAWVQGLSELSGTTTFFNFLDSHDGIGLPGAQGLLDAADIDMMTAAVRKKGGDVSYKSNGDGSTSPYELNITCYSALIDPEAEESEALQIQRYLASRAIPLALAGVPGVYLHGLLGSPNAITAVETEGTARSINRQTLNAPELYASLRDERGQTCRIFHALQQMIRKRRQEKAFHPNAAQTVLQTDERIFALLRSEKTASEALLCLTNISADNVAVQLNLDDPAFKDLPFSGRCRDLLSGKTYKAENCKLDLLLTPYTVIWLKPV